MPEHEPNADPAANEQRLVLWAVGALGFSCVITQLTLLRELLGAFGGNELVLGVALGNWLLLMGAGTWLGRILVEPQPSRDDQSVSLALRRRSGERAGERGGSPVCEERASSPRPSPPLRGGEGEAAAAPGSRMSCPNRSLVNALLPALLILVAVLPLLQVFLLRTLRDVVFVRGAAVGAGGTVVSAFVLLLPYCVVAGGALIVASSLLARAGGAGGVGRVYVADSLGSVLGGVAFSFVLVRFLDHFSILAFPAWLNLLLAVALSWCSEAKGRRLAPRLLSALAGVLAIALLAVSVLVDLDGISAGRQYPGQRILARANSPYGRLLVTESGGQLNFIESGLPLASTRDDQRVEETVHYAMAQRPDADRVLLMGGGFSGTAREILKYHVSRVDYVELDPLILEFGRRFLPENLADERIRTINTDGRRFIRQAAERYEVVIVDVPAPSTAQLNRFFTVEFFAEAKRVLAPGGVLSFQLGPYANYISPELARMLSSAHGSVKQSFRNVEMLPGGQIVFLASDGPVSAEVAPRLELRGIQTRLVRRPYLEAMLSADRMADLARAVAQPSALNEDFRPVLYYQHLRHWLSQFETRVGPVQVLLLVGLGVYLVRLRGAALVLFASGFAGASLEIVLLLAFQVLCGSVYHQVGVIVTVFMAGLALGAWLSGARTGHDAAPESSSSSSSSFPFISTTTTRTTTRTIKTAGATPRDDRRLLGAMALGIAVLAGLLPLVLFPLQGPGGWGASPFAVKAIIALLTLVLATLAGMQFPLANRLEFDENLAGASRLYTADFVGAFLGALLASTLLIPWLGVAGVCGLTAGLNVLAGAAMIFKKR